MLVRTPVRAWMTLPATSSNPGGLVQHTLTPRACSKQRGPCRRAGADDQGLGGAGYLYSPTSANGSFPHVWHSLKLARHNTLATLVGMTFTSRSDETRSAILALPASLCNGRLRAPTSRYRAAGHRSLDGDRTTQQGRALCAAADSTATARLRGSRASSSADSRPPRVELWEGGFPRTLIVLLRSRSNEAPRSGARCLRRQVAIRWPRRRTIPPRTTSPDSCRRRCSASRYPPILGSPGRRARHRKLIAIISYTTSSTLPSAHSERGRVDSERRARRS